MYIYIYIIIIIIILYFINYYAEFIHRTDRYCNKTTIVNGVTIPEGAVVTIPISLLHHSTKYWKDPETFDPERYKIQLCMCTYCSATLSNFAVCL